MEHQNHPTLPIWRSSYQDSKIEDVPNDEEDERIIARRNSHPIRVINLSDDPEAMAAVKESCKIFRKCLMGVIQDLRCFASDYLEDVLEKAWNIRRGRFFIRAKYKGTLLIRFEDREERDSVLERSPWDVNGALLMLAPWQEAVVMTSYRIEKTPVWVQIHGLPKDFLSARKVAKLGMVAGEVHLIDWPENSPYMRIRTIIKPDEPLVAGIYLMDQDGKRKDWVEFRYEGICVVCLRCGVIGHVKKFCNISTTDMNLRAESQMKEIRAKLCKELSAAKGLSFLVKFHGGCEFHIRGTAVTNQQARRPAGKHFHNPNGSRNFSGRQNHSNQQDNRVASSKPKMEWRPKAK